jgi:cell division transport system ATP-binding protein
MIRLLKVTYRYPNGRGIGDVSLTAKRGEFVLLEGPIGAGKSTILRLIYLDLVPQAGQIMIEGQYLHRFRGQARALLRRKMGIVFPETRLLPDRSVFDNVALPLRIAGASRRQIHLHTNRLLFRFGLQNRSRSRSFELSSGEQKKAAIARALVNQPFILLADEVLANVDGESAIEILNHLREINSEGTTILAVTHRPQPYGEMADRVLHLQEGALLEKARTIPS